MNRYNKSMLQALRFSGVVCVSIVASFFAPGANAHQEPIESGWCANGEIHILGTFNLNQLLLEKFRNEQDAVCNLYRSCGQFDDDYDLSFRTAGAICHSFSSDELAYRSQGDHLTVRPIFHSPVTMKNSEQNHHEIYSIEQGVEFSCGYCVIQSLEAESADTMAAEPASTDARSGSN